MTEPLQIALIAALAAITGAIIAAIITYVSTARRNKFEAIVEIYKYREKWLEQLRNEVTMLSSLYMVKMNSAVSPEERREFFKHLSKVNVLVNSSNIHWPELQKSLDNMIGAFGTDKPLGFPNFEQIAKKILQEEWKEIQGFLEGKK